MLHRATSQKFVAALTQSLRKVQLDSTSGNASRYKSNARVVDCIQILKQAAISPPICVVKKLRYKMHYKLLGVTPPIVTDLQIAAWVGEVDSTFIKLCPLASSMGQHGGQTPSFRKNKPILMVRAFWTDDAEIVKIWFWKTQRWFSMPLKIKNGWQEKWKFQD